MIFVDWLSVYQDFPDSHLPRLASEIRTYTCAITGELLKETTVGYVHEGSFDTSILIKFDGLRLYMSGNPSAFQRLDNLFGCRSVVDALAVFNNILNKLGYPSFFDVLHVKHEDLTDLINVDRLANPCRKSKKVLSGAAGLTFTRIDLTKNFCSDIDPLSMLRYLSSFTYRSTPGYLYPNGRTVDWFGLRSGDVGSSNRIYMKYYDKSHEIQKKLNKLKRKQKKLAIQSNDDFFTNAYLESQIAYLNKLLYFTLENNVVRFELELKGKKLADDGLKNLIDWSEEKMIIQLEKYLPHIKSVVQFNNKIDLYSQLIDAGVKPAYARTAASAGQHWLNGHDLHFKNSNFLTQATYYRVKKNLLFIGFDISAPLNIVNFPPQISTVKLDSLPVPAWYKLPASLVSDSDDFLDVA